MTIPTAKPKGAAKTAPRPNRQQGHNGWTILRVPSRMALRIYPSRYAQKNLAHLPQEVIWPGLEDWDGARLCIDAMMTRNLPALQEMVACYPEHTFGFESLLAGHDQTSEVAERVVLRSVPLKRNHHLDAELVTLHDERVQVLAVLRRGGQTIAQDVLYDSAVDEAEPESGIADAVLTMTVPN